MTILNIIYVVFAVLLLFGAAMVLIMIFKPRGLITTREPSVVLHGGRAPREGGNEARAPLAQERSA